MMFGVSYHLSGGKNIYIYVCVYIYVYIYIQF